MMSCQTKKGHQNLLLQKSLPDNLFWVIPKESLAAFFYLSYQKKAWQLSFICRTKRKLGSFLLSVVPKESLAAFFYFYESYQKKV